ncbi:MAG: Pimeloyl-ACP methyl ester carboxylesterase [Frankiales bacterium]|nr:Pimeloyl-ACP methyl ester carboxylesterase [Frankiales bacterium]
MIEAQYVDLSDSLAYVEAAGEGRAVLCLHTAGQSGVQWRHTLSGLSALGYRVIVPDLPGHGRSEPAAGGPIRDLGRYAEWCIELIDELGLDRPYVMGCSIGGKLSLDIATRIPDRLSGVVAMAAQAEAPSPGGVAGLERGLEDASSPSRTDRTYYGTLAVCGRRVPPERVEMISAMHRREDPVVTTSDLIGWFSHDIRDRLERITCPTYLVVGDDDFWLDLDKVRWTGRQIKGSQTLVLEGIGHYPMEEVAGFPAVAHEWLTALAADAARPR